jgi:hypothetical protein
MVENQMQRQVRGGNNGGLGDVSPLAEIDPARVPGITCAFPDSDAALDRALRSMPTRRAPRDLVDRILARAECETDSPV